MIDLVTNGGALPVLEAATHFAARRGRLIQHNVANLSTPNHRPMDLPIETFQASLKDAIGRRWREHGNTGGSMERSEVRRMRELEPTPMARNVLFHDGNDRDLERTMQDLAENLSAYRVNMMLLRREFRMLQMAIRERV